jgi:CheY-like chemotaxis protein
MASNGALVAASTAAEVLDAARGYLWILLAAVVVWRLFPVIRKRVESEEFSVEVAGQKVSFASASRQLHGELDDLRSQVLKLTEHLDSLGDAAADEPEVEPEEFTARPARILWVDDRPENNAFLIKSLEDREAEVVQAMSTDEAIGELESSPRGFDLVISDMGRKERGGYRGYAGVDLIRRMRDRNLMVPVVIYASSRAIERGGEQALDAGAVAATASPTELLQMLRIGPTTAFEASVADIVRRHLDATPFPIYRSVDFVAERGGERIGIEIKNWAGNPTPEAFERALGRVVAARQRYGFDRILMITRQGIQVPEGVQIPAWVDVRGVDDFVASLPAPARRAL